MSKIRGKKDKDLIITSLSLLVASALVLICYRVLIGYFYEKVLIAYMVIATVFVLGYVIYNRGFSRKGVTPDMLPDDWSEDKKQEFVEDGKRRMRRSRWMLVIIVAFLFTFVVDMIELWVLPFMLSML